MKGKTDQGRAQSAAEVAAAVEAHGSMLAEQHHASLHGRLQRHTEEHEAELTRTKTQHDAENESLTRTHASMVRFEAMFETFC